MSDNTVELGIALLILVFIGFVAGRAGGGEPRGPRALDLIVSHAAVPALIFMIVSDARVEQIGSLDFVLAAAFAFYLTFMIMFVVAATAGRAEIRVAALQAAAASHANAGLIGIPLAVILFGFKAALGAVLVFAAGAVVQAVTMGAIQAVARPRLAGRALGSIGGAVFLDPMMLAIMLGAAAAHLTPELPGAVANLFDLLGQAALAVAFLAVGAQIAKGERGRPGPEIPVIAIVKLAVSPAVTLGVFIAIGGFDPAWIAIGVLISALPTAPGLMAAARRYDVYLPGAGAAVHVTTIVSLITVPVLALMIIHDLLPLSAAALLSY